MSFTRYFEIFVNTAAGPGGTLLASFNNSQQQAPDITWVAGDIFELRLRFGVPGTGTLDPVTPIAFDDTDQIIVAGRPAANLEETDLLFSATGFTKNVVGEDIYYSATLDLSPTNLATEIAATGNGYLKCLVDIKDENAANTSRMTLPQFAVTIKEAVYRGTEGVPLTGDPVYPTPGQLLINTYIRTFALSSGADTGSVDFTALGLTAAPRLVVPLSISKHAGGDANLYATFIQAGITATAANFELNAPTDNASRILSYLVIP